MKPIRLCEWGRPLMLAFSIVAAPISATADEDGNAAMLTVSGEITYRERIALPPEAVLRATLQDISRADARSEVLAELTAEPTRVPASFALEVPRDELRPRGRYGVRGTIHSATGELLWTTDTVIPVDPVETKVDVGRIVMARAASERGPRANVFRCGENIVLAAFDDTGMVLTRAGRPHRLEREASASGARFVGADALSFWISGENAQLGIDGEERECTPASPSAFLTSGEWVVEDIDGAGVIDRSRTSMTFGADDRIAGLAGCNSYTGAWQAEGSRLETSGIAQTSKACVPVLGEQEAAFVEILTRADRYHYTTRGALVVTDEAGRKITARQQ